MRILWGNRIHRKRGVFYNSGYFFPEYYEGIELTVGSGFFVMGYFSTEYYWCIELTVGAEFFSLRTVQGIGL